MRNNDNPISSQEADAALAEIEYTLEQMLVLAKLSASNLDVDRAALQRTLEHLQRKVDNIADGLEGV